MYEDQTVAGIVAACAQRTVLHNCVVARIRESLKTALETSEHFLLCLSFSRVETERFQELGDSPSQHCFCVQSARTTHGIRTPSL